MLHKISKAQPLGIYYFQIHQLPLIYWGYTLIMRCSSQIDCLITNGALYMLKHDLCWTLLCTGICKYNNLLLHWLSSVFAYFCPWFVQWSCTLKTIIHYYKTVTNLSISRNWGACNSIFSVKNFWLSCCCFNLWSYV